VPSDREIEVAMNAWKLAWGENVRQGYAHFEAGRLAVEQALSAAATARPAFSEGLAALRRIASITGPGTDLGTLVRANPETERIVAEVHETATEYI
jgi:hypothetical protein